MGTWGTGLYDSDNASDTRMYFRDALDQGLSIDQTIKVVFKEMGFWSTKDPEVQLVLANELLERGITTHPILTRARKIILSEAEIRAHWQGNASDEATQQRKAILKELLARLPTNGSAHAPLKLNCWWSLWGWAYSCRYLVGQCIGITIACLLLRDRK